jgi:sulfatase maturation enzyme AslB (radical SAM superfamily)
MHREDYCNQIENNTRFIDLYTKDYKKRLMFARDNGCNTVMLTGNGEPLLNKRFLERFALWNESLPKPFVWIEIQTSGTLLDDEYLRYLRNTVGVNTISLSLSNIFDSDKNAEYNRTQAGVKIDIDKLCDEIKKYDFNLRLSLNMTDYYNDTEIKSIFERAKQLGADQITFRKLYTSSINGENEQNKWIEKHACASSKYEELTQYVKKNSTPLEVLPFGAIKYSLGSFAVVVDDDSMSTQIKDDTVKYLILRENCKLYSKWEDKNSLIF